MRFLSTLLLLAALLSGCSGALPGRGTGSSRPPASPISGQSFTSVRQLRDASRVVVWGVATDAHASEVSRGAPFTITVVRVVQVWWGTVPGTTIRVRQLESTVAGTTVSQQRVPVVQSGNAYILFLLPDDDEPGERGDQYVITGAGAGLFAENDGVATRLDPLSPNLPARLPVATLMEQLGS